jgi:hypothetical protein
MKFKSMTARIATAFALVPIFLLSMQPETVSARSAPNGSLHVTKQCSNPPYTGAAGDSCTITSSNLAEIKVGSKVVYDQAFGIPKGLLDSNVVLDAGAGNRAVGRCTLDFSTFLGLCTFSDGTGEFAGFTARVNVSLDSKTGLFHWDGTYHFGPEPDRDGER